MSEGNYERVKDKSFWQEEQGCCNCGSFALDVTEWICHYDNNEQYTEDYRKSIIVEMYEEGFAMEDIFEVILELDAEAILAACPWIELIDLADAMPDDKVVAYRLYIDEEELAAADVVDDDFHFRVRIGGFWFEKCGCDPIHLCGTEAQTDPWVTSRYIVYTGPIKYFRFKKV